MTSEASLKIIFKKTIGKIILNSLCLSIPFVTAVLTIGFLSSERNKLELLTSQLAAVIKPKIQIGDEIEIRNLLTKSIETTDALWLSVSGDKISQLVASRLPSRMSENELSRTNYMDVFFSPYIVKISNFKIYPNSEQSFVIKVAYPNTVRANVLLYTLLATLAISIFLSLILFFRLKSVLSKISRPLENLKCYIESFDAARCEANTDIDQLTETKSIKENFDLLQSRLERQKLDLLTKSVEEVKGKMASQLGHDLKSYTSILLSALENLRSKVGDDDLLILQKAASDISAKMQQLHRLGSESLGRQDESFVLQLAPCVASMVELKKLEYGSIRNLKIEFDFALSDLSVFAKVNPLELRVAISNLINNSVEAIAGEGLISISVKEENNRATIVIKDNGRGISKDLIEKIKEAGFSTKNGFGRGVGLTKALEIVNQDGGDLLIESEVNIGTTIKLCFLSEWPRKSFVSEIKVFKKDRVILVDDQATSQERIKNILSGKISTVSILTFSSSEQVEEWIESNNLKSSDLILMDYDLGQTKQTGIDLIEKFCLQNQSILLTHNDSNSNVLEDCDLKNIKMIPKSIFEKICFLKEENDSFEFKECDGYVIDDNEVHILNLKQAAKKKGLILKCYKRMSEFLKDVPMLNPRTPVLIDSMLENGELGEMHAKNLYDNLGFKEILLNTSHDRDHFRSSYPDGMYWIKKIISKEHRPEAILGYIF